MENRVRRCDHKYERVIRERCESEIRKYDRLKDVFVKLTRLTDAAVDNELVNLDSS